MNREAVAKGRQLGHTWTHVRWLTGGLAPVRPLPGLGLLTETHFWHPDGWGMLLVPRWWWASSALARAALVR